PPQKQKVFHDQFRAELMSLFENYGFWNLPDTSPHIGNCAVEKAGTMRVRRKRNHESTGMGWEVKDCRARRAYGSRHEKRHPDSPICWGADFQTRKCQAHRRGQCLYLYL